ncbi:MAG: hypothetical protein ACRDHM_02905 [Actinomycetota bacterium]
MAEQIALQPEKRAVARARPPGVDARRRRPHSGREGLAAALQEPLDPARILSLQALVGNRSVEKLIAENRSSAVPTVGPHPSRPFLPLQGSFREPPPLVSADLETRGGKVSKTATAKKVMTLGAKKSGYNKIVGLVQSYERLELEAGRKDASLTELRTVLTGVAELITGWIDNKDHSEAVRRGDRNAVERKTALEWLRPRVGEELRLLRETEAFASMALRSILAGIDPLTCVHFGEYEGKVREHRAFKKLTLVGTVQKDAVTVLHQEWTGAYAGKIREHLAGGIDGDSAHKILLFIGRFFHQPADLNDLKKVLRSVNMSRVEAEAFLAAIPPFDQQTRRREISTFKSLQLVKAAEGLEGKLHWFGASGPAGAQYQISPTTLTGPGKPNDFARWMLALGPEPDETSTMNCWEAVLFMGYRGGLVTLGRLREIHNDASQAARNAGTTKEYYDRLEKRMYSGTRQAFVYDPHAADVGSPDIPTGSIIFIDGLGHVLLGTGGTSPTGRHQVISHWVFPWPGGQWTVLGGRVQATTLEETLDRGYADEYRNNTPPSVLFGTPAW